MNPSQILISLDPNTVRCAECQRCIDEKVNIDCHHKCSFGVRNDSAMIVCILCGWPKGTSDYNIYYRVMRYINTVEIERIYYNFYDIVYDESNQKIIFTPKPEKDESV